VSGSSDIIEFGAFRLDLQHRQLSRSGEPLTVSSRAFDILALLATHRDRVVSKDEIMSQVWRGTIVEENNLAVQISALRRVLNDPAEAAPVILTIPGQGYRFVGRVAETGAPANHAEVAPQEAPPVAAAPPRRAPALLPLVPSWLKGAVAAAALGSLSVKLMLLWFAAPAPHALAPAAPPRLSIAVLPFRDLSDDRCCDYLADAISDDLTTDLSHIPGSTVIARESSDAFRGRAVSTAEIGHALNVRYLLEGSLRAVEGRFSINAQLIEAANGSHLWAERFEVPRDHLAAAQNQIVQRLASALGVTLVDIEGSASLRERAQNPDALYLFLRARSILDRSDTLASMTEAQHLLEQAVAKQPGFIEAQAELAWLLPRKANNFAYATQDADLAEARATVAEALRPGNVNAAAPGTALALAAKGALQGNDGHCEEAASSYRAALAIAPDSVQAQTGQIACLTALGRFDEVVPGLATLMRIDPESPRNKVRAQQLGFAELMLDQPAQAIPWLQQSMAGDPEPAPGADDLGRVEWSRLLLIAAEAMVGNLDAAKRLYAEHIKVWPYRTVWHLGSELTRAQASLKPFAAIEDAWRQVGMPEFADEHADFGVAEGSPAREHRRLEPTPMALRGIASIDAAGLAAKLQAPSPPRVVDFGFGAAMPANAQLETADPGSAGEMAALARQLGGGREVVVMGQGPLDWTGVSAARSLAGDGLRVSWFRGGEEAWAKAGLPAVDRRPR
jgi:TolB-like protein/DNA-binding winged helix-turn-helix (wHTH) protein/Tfp pilus assembly protein PilF